MERYTLTSYVNRIHIPALQISPALASQILGRDLAPLLEAGTRESIESKATVELGASLHRTVVADRSVVAKVEGSDPKLKDEAVIVSAHYDHNGQDGSQIFNGADDNASGTVAVLDIAEAYVAAAQQGKRPRRTVIFAVWGSEERCCGPLLGSWAWIEHPLWPLEKTVATINMDMIGRSEEVPETGGPRFTGLKPQKAGVNANSVHVMGYSFSPDQPAPPQRPVALPAARRSGRIRAYWPASRLSHHQRPPRAHRLRQGRANRPPRLPGKLGSGNQRLQAEDGEAATDSGATVSDRLPQTT